MWGYSPAGAWSRLPGIPTIVPPRVNIFVEYDPVRRHTVALGAAHDYPWDTATRVFPASRASNSLPAAMDWSTLLPDGPPRNPGGAGVSPSNDFLAETLVFDRRRRAMVAPGLSGYDPCCEGVPRPTWHMYEYRYVDQVQIDSQPAMVWTPPGANAALSVKAVGAGTVSYRWRHEGQNLAEGSGYSGTASATLTVNQVTDHALGHYDVIISNRCGAVFSRPIVLAYNGTAALGLGGAGGANVSLNLVGEPGVEVTIQSAVSPVGPWVKVQNVTFPANGAVAVSAPINAGAVFYRSVFPAY